MQGVWGPDLSGYDVVDDEEWTNNDRGERAKRSVALIYTWVILDSMWVLCRASATDPEKIDKICLDPTSQTHCQR